MEVISILRDRISNLFKKNSSEQNSSPEALEKIQKEEQEKNEIRQTEKYKFYMEKCSMGELKSIIAYNHPYATDPSFNLSKEELEEIKVLIKTANVALEDKTKQMQEELSQDVRKR